MLSSVAKETDLNFLEEVTGMEQLKLAGTGGACKACGMSRYSM